MGDNLKKESVFINKINKNIKNNQEYCNVREEKIINNIINNNSLNIDEKIEKLFNTNGYVFNKDVDIITNNKKYHTRIAGKVNNYLITFDNDIINISSIKDIVF